MEFKRKIKYHWCPFGCGKKVVCKRTNPPRYDCEKCGTVFRYKPSDNIGKEKNG